MEKMNDSVKHIYLKTNLVIFIKIKTQRAKTFLVLFFSAVKVDNEYTQGCTQDLWVYGWKNDTYNELLSKNLVGGQSSCYSFFIVKSQTKR